MARIKGGMNARKKHNLTQEENRENASSDSYGSHVSMQLQE